MSEYINLHKSVIALSSQSEQVKDSTEYKNIRPAVRGLSDKEGLVQREYLKRILDVYKNFAYLEIFTPTEAKNVVLVPYDVQLKISEDAFNKGFSTRDWYKGAMEKKGIFVSEAYVSASIGKPVVAISTPILDNNNIVGVYIGALTLEALSDMTKSLSYGNTGITYIVDKNGNLVAHPEKSFLKESKLVNLKDTSIVSTMLSNSSEKAHTNFLWDSITGQNVYATYKKIPGIDWYIISQQSEKEALKDVTSIKIKILIVMFITMIIITITMIRLSKYLLDDLKHLKNYIKRNGGS